MLIRVQYEDRSYGMVDDTALESLISEDRILGFQRSSEWVRIGVDPVRSHRIERRRTGALINIYV
ncbi:MAG: hypothetical protein ED859_11995 [Desulfuromonadales bacterium]|nr:MAG: hypothetical protein ED859_11995 [Desulfuromonadales bacterium]